MNATESDEIVRIFRERSRPLEPRPTGVVPDLRPLQDIAAVVFDIYGTMLVSGSGDVGSAMTETDRSPEVAALRAVFGDNAPVPPPEPVAATVRRHQGLLWDAGVAHPEIDIREAWTDRLLAAGCRDFSARQVEAAATHYEASINPVWPMPGMAETLDVLRGRVRLGVVSNAQFHTPALFPALTGRTLDEFGFDPHLRQYSFRLRVGKPDGLPYRHMAARLELLGVRPAQTLYIGNDMLKDVTPAAAVGFRTALFAGDARSLRRREGDDRCRGVAPDRVVTELAQVPGLLAE